jgi:phosphate transport system protein
MEQHEHIVGSYEEEPLNNKMAKMGGLAEEMVAQSLDALEKRNRRLAQSIIEQDDAIDALEQGDRAISHKNDRQAATRGL